MPALTLFDQSEVAPSEIDSLGHMNVRFYVSRVARANEELLKHAGIEAAEGQSLRRVDTYSRFRREQFAGATLQTLGGLIAGEGVDGVEGVRAYFEIRNAANGELAANFIVTSRLIDTASQSVLAQPAGWQLAESPFAVRLPPHGAPRSLSLAPPRVVALEEIEAAVGNEPGLDMMSGRREGVVHGEDCDSDGLLREDVDLMFVAHHQRTEQGAPESFGPPLLRDALGRRYSWAMMETRNVVWQRPRVADELVSIGANLAFAEKWRQSRRWIFVKDSGLLLGVHDILAMCIDLDARRAIPIPDEVRAVMERNCLPQFA